MQYLRCREQNLIPQHFAQFHLEVPSALMHFIAMDLIGKFKPSSQDHQYALTAIDMLKNYTMCMLLHTTDCNEVVHAYLVNIYLKFGISHDILSDNEVASVLGIDTQFTILFVRQWTHRNYTQLSQVLYM